MKQIERIGEPEIIMRSDIPHRDYFAWPTVARLRDGRIAVSASGFRRSHICPFGKAVMMTSSDEGTHYTVPEIVINTVLDDRDSGLCPFGESGLILTSFNNTVEFQRRYADGRQDCIDYLDSVDPADEAEALGSRFRMSRDNGATWGELLRSPVTTPHGPICLRDGRIFYLGSMFGLPNEEHHRNVRLYEILPDGTARALGEIEDIYDENGELALSCEPHLIELPDGTLIAHIRVQHRNTLFTTYQSESHDGGLTFTTPRRLLGLKGGAPAHLLLHSSGTLISAYGYREKPFGIRLMFSEDGGASWQTDVPLYEQDISADLGYPATVECRDGTLLTVFYAHASEDSPAVIWQQRWRFVL